MKIAILLVAVLILFETILRPRINRDKKSGHIFLWYTSLNGLRNWVQIF